jgi:hypothetical protein
MSYTLRSFNLQKGHQSLLSDPRSERNPIAHLRDVESVYGNIGRLVGSGNARPRCEDAAFVEPISRDMVVP